jgi:protein-S-isoprenylcysteine O-methyltransferase Ste14
MCGTPLYLTSILFYLCLTVTTASLLALVLFAGIAVFYNYIADYEEGVLPAKYGEEYSEYRERTGKWLPCIGPGRYRKRRSEKDDPG